jgi:glycosyltransferase involved in cell wall biosynthesis
LKPRLPKVAVVVTTYNRPTALAWSLASLTHQSVAPDQIVVADDGSGPQTQALVAQWQTALQRDLPGTRLVHAWQPDEGFRAAAARNLAVRQACEAAEVDRQPKPDLLIFMDGDCIAPTWFVEHHLRLYEPGRLVAGGRGLLTPTYTEQLERQVINDLGESSTETSTEASTQTSCVTLTIDWPVRLRVFGSPYWLWLTKRCDRFWPMVPLTSRFSRFLQPLRDGRPRDESLVRTCNLSLSLQDFERVGGFDEGFVGWGLEDTDFALRLIQQGVSVRSGRFATNVYHLWHAERSRDQLQVNAARLERTRACLS